MRTIEILRMFFITVMLQKPARNIRKNSLDSPFLHRYLLRNIDTTDILKHTKHLHFHYKTVCCRFAVADSFFIYFRIYVGMCCLLSIFSMFVNFNIIIGNIGNIPIKSLLLLFFWCFRCCCLFYKSATTGNRIELPVKSVCVADNFCCWIYGNTEFITANGKFITTISLGIMVKSWCVIL